MLCVGSAGPIRSDFVRSLMQEVLWSSKGGFCDPAPLAKLSETE